MRGTLVDLRQAARLILLQPTFSLFAILSLAVGIGAATAVFTLVNTSLLRQLPFREPDRLAWMYNARTERERAPFSIPDLQDYAREATTVAALAPFTNWTANLTGIGEPERLEGTRVAGTFFDVLGSPPALGRVLTAQDEAADAKVAVITHGLWARRFGGDPTIVGRPVLLNGTAYTVVGVLPTGFLFPFRYAEVAVPLALRDDRRRADRGANFIRVVARLEPGVTFTQAKAELDTIARRLQHDFPDDDARKIGVNLYPLHEEIVSDYRRILWTLFGAVGALLVVGCGNLANLLLVRALGRRTELSVRASLGASRGRLVRQLTTEALLLVMVGALGGVAVAAGAVAVWRSAGPANFPRMDALALDSRVLAFAGAVSLLTGWICGVVPARSASRDLAGGLQDTTRMSTGGRRHGRARRMFVALQVGGSAIVLVCMGLVARGLHKLEQVDPGFSADHALTIQLSLPPTRYATTQAISAYHDAVHARLSSVSGVRDVGAVSLLPLSGLLSTVDVALPDRPAPPPDEVPQAHFRMAGPGYFVAAGIALVDGRTFTDRDTDRGRPVAIVSRSFAARHWPGESAVGKRVDVVLSPPAVSLEVIGVVNDVKQFDLDRPPTADLYIPLHQMPASQAALLAARMYWIVRTEADPGRLRAAVSQAVRVVDPDVATSGVRTLEEIRDASLSATEVNVSLLEVFGQFAVVLSAIGVYAMAAFSAGERRREIAIRSAFGASHGQLVLLMCREELRPVLIGLAAGVVTAALFVPSALDRVFGTSLWDPATYATVAAVLLVVGSVASYLPAHRAAGTDPAELLR